MTLPVTTISCTPKQTQSLLQPSEALGTILAQETASLAAANKRVAVISPDAGWGAPSTAEEAFKRAMKQQGFDVVTAKSANLGDPMRRGQLGLKTEDFLEALEKSADAGALVSFAGAPLMKAADAAQLNPKHPPVLVLATASLGNVPGMWSDPIRLADLIDATVVELAIIDTQEPGPQIGKADATRQLFDQHYHILRRVH